MYSIDALNLYFTILLFGFLSFSDTIISEYWTLTQSQLTMGCIFDKCSQVSEDQENTNAVEVPQTTYSWYEGLT